MRVGRIPMVRGQKNALFPAGWNEDKSKIMYKPGASAEKTLYLQSLYKGCASCFIHLFNTHSSKEQIPCLRLNTSTHSVELWKYNWER